MQDERAYIREDVAGAPHFADTDMDLIEKHRTCIDDIDERLVQLLNERASHSLAIRELKARVKLGLFDPRREEDILQHVERCNDGPLYNDHLRELYASLLKVMKEVPSP